MDQKHAEQWIAEFVFLPRASAGVGASAVKTQIASRIREVLVSMKLKGSLCI